MIEIKSILSPVDFSDVSLLALGHAAQLAKWFEAKLTILHVHEPPVPPMPAPYGAIPAAGPMTFAPASSEAEIAAAVERFAARADTAGIDVRLRVRTGIPVNEIVDEADAVGSDLIVVGTHGRAGFDRLILGSVAEKLLRKSPRPVMTVPPAVTEPPHALGLFKRILCPMDFSEASLKALDYVFPFAKEADADVILMHIIEGIPDSAGLRTTLTSAFAEELRVMEEEAARRLQAAVPDHARPWCRPSTLLLRGKPYREILRVAEERAVRLIVMGVQGLGAVSRLFFGSTTSQVVRSATCPVLTLKT